MDWLKSNNERGIFTEYMMSEIETSKSFDNKTLDEVLAYFSKSEFEFTREQAFPHLKPLLEEDSEEIENQNNSPISTPRPEPVHLVEEISDPFSDLSIEIFKPGQISVEDPAQSDSGSTQSGNDSDAASDLESTKLNISNELLESLTNLKKDLEMSSYEDLINLSNEDLFTYYNDLKDANLEIPTNLIEVMLEKGLDLSFLSFFISYLKNLKTEDTPKYYTIKIPARTTVITVNEVSNRDYEDMELLRVMDRYEILEKVSYQELLYFEQLFEVFEEELPSEMQTVLDYYDLKNNKPLSKLN
jgi:hypothetical protein